MASYGPTGISNGSQDSSPSQSGTGANRRYVRVDALFEQVRQHVEVESGGLERVDALRVAHDGLRT